MIWITYLVQIDSIKFQDFYLPYDLERLKLKDEFCHSADIASERGKTNSIGAQMRPGILKLLTRDSLTCFKLTSRVI